MEHATSILPIDPSRYLRHMAPVPLFPANPSDWLLTPLPRTSEQAADLMVPSLDELTTYNIRCVLAHTRHYRRPPLQALGIIAVRVRIRFVPSLRVFASRAPARGSYSLSFPPLTLPSRPPHPLGSSLIEYTGHSHSTQSTSLPFNLNLKVQNSNIFVSCTCTVRVPVHPFAQAMTQLRDSWAQAALLAGGRLAARADDGAGGRSEKKIAQVRTPRSIRYACNA